MADVFNAEVVGVDSEEGAALGAALQAVWVARNDGEATGGSTTIQSIGDRYVGLNESTRTRPDQDRVAIYRQMQELHNRIVADLGRSFSAHRQMIAGR
jgi:sugar (pentulose or hexulose) kinase